MDDLQNQLTADLCIHSRNHVVSNHIVACAFLVDSDTTTISTKQFLYSLYGLALWAPDRGSLGNRGRLQNRSAAPARFASSSVDLVACRVGTSLTFAIEIVADAATAG